MRKHLLLALLASAATTSPALAQSAPSAYTSALRYDAERRVTGTISPDPDGTGPLKYAATRNSYDAAGRLTKVEKGELSVWQPESVDPADWGAAFIIHERVETAYDKMGRKTREAHASGTTTHGVNQTNYDLNGRVLCTATRMTPAQFATSLDACDSGPSQTDRVTKNSYDEAGQLLKVQTGFDTTAVRDEVTNTYTLNGKREFITDANGNKAQFAYDGHDRQSHWYFPDKATSGTVSTTDYEQYGYDANGNRTSLRKRDGSVLGFSYDALNRMTVKTVPARSGLTAAQTRDVYYSYDLRGLQTEARFDSLAGEGVSNEYNDAGWLLSTTDSTGGTARTLSFVHDRNGNRIRIVHPDGAFFTYSYDELNRVRSMSENAVTTLLNISYDSAGRRLRMNRAGGNFTTYGYDDASRLESLAHDLDGTGTANDVTFSYGYNAASQVTALTTGNDAYAFTPANTSLAFGRNGLNQYTNVNTTTLAYDANGNLIDGGSTNFTYDVENRLVGASGGRTASFAYDPLGRLHQTAGTATMRFLYDGDALVAEYSSTGTLLKRYVHGPGVDEPLVQYEGATVGEASRRNLFANHQGSIVALSDGTGAATHINRYDEYGVPAATNFGRFQYTGQTWLPEIGHYHYKARIYWAGGGRFFQVDPVGYEDQYNLYAYVGNDPVNAVDPNGTYTCHSGKEACQKISEYVEEVRGAARASSETTGTRIRSAYSTALSTLARFMGREGQDNGVTINNADLEEGRLGATRSGPSGTVAVRLDLAAIAASRGSTGAGTLAHEATHGVQFRSNGQPTSLGEVYHNEWVANSMESITNEILGQRSSLWYPKISGQERRRRIRRASSLSCQAVQNAYTSRFGGQVCR